jgi:P27 family predicted phage terminase small subunit
VINQVRRQIEINHRSQEKIMTDPVPFELARMRGFPGKRRPRPEVSPTISAEPPPAPSHLSPYAVEEWQRIGPELHRLHLLTMIDTAMFEVYCESYAQWRVAVELIEKCVADDPVKRGLLVQGSVADKVQNPLLIVARRAAEAMVAVAGEFGQSPRARARLAAAGFPPSGGGTSKFGDLLKG